LKKLLHLQLLPLLTGVQNFSLHLLEGLEENEFEIHVASQPGGPLMEAVRQRGYNYHPLSQLRHPISGRDLLAFWQIYRLCRRERFDIVHTNSSKPGLLGRIAARLAGVPLVIHSSHGTPFQRGQRVVPYVFFVILEWLGGLFCDKVAFVNHSDRLNCVKMGILPEDKAVTIYNALPPEQVARLAGSVISAKAGTDPTNHPAQDLDNTHPDFDSRVGRFGNRPYILVGSTLRFSTQKNIIEVILAACEACALEPRLRFVFVGEGEHYQLCRAIVSSKKLNDRILLPGWDNEISLWLATLDVFVLYSRWEALPFSIIEANYSGLPVIGSAIPSIRELVNDEVGWLVPLDNRPALVRILTALPDQSAAILHKGALARQRIAGLCDYASMVDGYLKLYRSLPGE